jgi:hypothetical protein
MKQDLQRFDYHLETNHGILPRSSASISSGNNSLAGAEPRVGAFDNYLILDAKRAP